jgi:hypothetical protein
LVVISLGLKSEFQQQKHNKQLNFGNLIKIFNRRFVVIFFAEYLRSLQSRRKTFFANRIVGFSRGATVAILAAVDCKSGGNSFFSTFAEVFIKAISTPLSNLYR